MHEFKVGEQVIDATWLAGGIGLRVGKIFCVCTPDQIEVFWENHPTDGPSRHAPETLIPYEAERLATYRFLASTISYENSTAMSDRDRQNLVRVQQLAAKESAPKP
jgi:hypothetical protein